MTFEKQINHLIDLIDLNVYFLLIKKYKILLNQIKLIKKFRLLTKNKETFHDKKKINNPIDLSYFILYFRFSSSCQYMVLF